MKPSDKTTLCALACNALLDRAMERFGDMAADLRAGTTASYRWRRASASRWVRLEAASFDPAGLVFAARDSLPHEVAWPNLNGVKYGGGYWHS